MNRALKLAFVVLIVAGGGYWIGLFDSPSDYVLKDIEGFQFVMLPRRGGFDQIPDAMAEVAALVRRAANVDEADMSQTQRGVGVFFDNPHEVPLDECRWFIGFAVPQNSVRFDRAKLADLSSQVRLIDVPNARGIETTLPWRHAMSPMLGALKVWSKFYAHIASNQLIAGPAVEFYTVDEQDRFQMLHYVIYQDDSVNKLLSWKE